MPETCTLNPESSTRREVFFETNGVPRMVEVEDRRQAAADAIGAAGSKRAARERADPSQLGSVASPMSGEIIEIVAKPGETGHLIEHDRYPGRPKPESVFSVRWYVYAVQDGIPRVVMYVNWQRPPLLWVQGSM